MIKLKYTSTKAKKTFLVIAGIFTILFSLFIIGVETQAQNTALGVDILPIRIAYDPVNKSMYLADPRNDSVSVINTTNNKVVGSPAPVGGWPVGIAYDPVNKAIYVAGNNSVYVIDTTNNKVV